MPSKIYFDVDAFRFLGEAFAVQGLPQELRNRIVLDPLTAIEVLAQLCTPEAEVILAQIKAVPNWIDTEHAPILPWMDDVIAQTGFDVVPNYSDITDRVGNALERCFHAPDAAALRQSAEDVRRLLDAVKDETVAALNALIGAHNQNPEAIAGLDQAWFGFLKRRARIEITDHTVDDLKLSLDAAYQFEMAKVQEAVAIQHYNVDRRRNDCIDVEHLVYLSIPEMKFLTCDRGYRRKVAAGEQLGRICTSTPAELRNRNTAEALLRELTR